MSDLDVPYIDGQFNQEKEYWYKRIIRHFPSLKDNPEALYGDNKLLYFRLINEGLIAEVPEYDPQSLEDFVSTSVGKRIDASQIPINGRLTEIDRTIKLVRESIGVAPGSPNDATTALLVGDVNSSTRQELDKAAFKAAGEWVGSINVIDYGAKTGSTNNSTAAFLAAKTVSQQTGKPMYIPKGMFYIDPDSFVAFDHMKIYGAGHNQTYVMSTNPQRVGAGFTLKQGVEIFNIQVRGFGEGLRNVGYWTKIHDMKLSYNLVGLHLAELSYICKVYDNDITFNTGIGILCGNEPYQTDIHHNIIDNNNGVGVAMYGNTGGLIINNNTIEGNRNYTTKFGCAILMTSSNLSRTTIKANWFEANGSDPDSCDIHMLGPETAVEPYRIGKRIVEELVPTEYRGLFYFNNLPGVVKGNGTGAVTIEDNGFIFTPINCVIAGGSRVVYSIKSNVFKGVLGVYNKHIWLSFEPTSVLKETTVTITGNSYNNTDSTVINSQVLTGIGGSYVHPPREGALLTSRFANFTFNGNRLFEKSFTLKELLDEFPLTPLKPWIVTGTGTVELAKKLNNVHEGYVNKGGSAISYGSVADSTEWLNLKNRLVIFLGEPNTRVRMETAPGVWAYSSLVSEDTSILRVTKLPATMTTGKMYINSGDVIYGAIIIPVEKEYLFNGISNVHVTNWSSDTI